MKTLFITAYNTFISRNIFGTSVLASLKERKDLRIVIFCPPNKVQLFTDLYGGSSVIFEGLDMEPIVKKPWNKKLYRLSFLLENTQYVKDQRLERYWNNKSILSYVNYLWVNSLALILSTFSFLHPLYRMCDFYFSNRRILKPWFDKYNPDFLFSSDAFGDIDIWFQKEARSRGVSILDMVRSWDNTTTKGILRIIPDYVIVNSKTTKKELIKMHGVEEEKITIVGLPQFDRWISGPTVSREEFFKSIGADTNKKLVLFAPAGHVLSETDWQLCQMLQEAIQKNKFINPVQFLVRNHPQHPADLSRFSSDENFIIEHPGIVTKEGDQRNSELRPSDNDHLRNSLYYSDVIMYIATTLGLDAQVFDKPQIMISFDGREKLPYIQSVKRYNREDCLANLVKLGGTRVVYSEEELIKAINDYLSNSRLDSESRRKIITEHMHMIDGKSGERISNLLLSFISR